MASLRLPYKVKTPTLFRKERERRMGHPRYLYRLSEPGATGLLGG